MRFLPIGVPYHSRYLAGCTSLLMRPTSEGGLAGAEEQWWDAHQRSMTVPVYNTETGEDLRQAEGKGLMQSLADQIFTSPIRWVKACTFPEDTTHTVDFGLGSLSGIGSLVARNVEGKGNRVVFAGLPVAGQGGKAMNEVYDSRKLVREEKWTKKFQNTLVKTRCARCSAESLPSSDFNFSQRRQDPLGHTVLEAAQQAAAHGRRHDALHRLR